MKQRADHGNAHPGLGQEHPLPCPLGRAEPLEPKDEQHRGQDVEISQHVSGLDVLQSALRPQDDQQRDDQNDHGDDRDADDGEALFTLVALALEHLEHAVGNQEPAKDIRGRAGDRKEAEDGAEPCTFP